MATAARTGRGTILPARHRTACLPTKSRPAGMAVLLLPVPHATIRAGGGKSKFRLALAGTDVRAPCPSPPPTPSTTPSFTTAARLQSFAVLAAATTTVISTRSREQGSTTAQSTAAAAVPPATCSSALARVPLAASRGMGRKRNAQPCPSLGPRSETGSLAPLGPAPPPSAFPFIPQTRPPLSASRAAAPCLGHARAATVLVPPSPSPSSRPPPRTWEAGQPPPLGPGSRGNRRRQRHFPPSRPRHSPGEDLRHPPGSAGEWEVALGQDDPVHRAGA